MIKVYLLLRNNKQSGPYSLEEISRQQLKPLDLVWIEGRSAAWKYASEISELSQFLPGADQRPNLQPGQNSPVQSDSINPSASAQQPGAHDAYLPKAVESVSENALPLTKKIHVSLPANAQRKQDKPLQQNLDTPTEQNSVRPVNQTRAAASDRPVQNNSLRPSAPQNHSTASDRPIQKNPSRQAPVGEPLPGEESLAYQPDDRNNVPGKRSPEQKEKLVTKYSSSLGEKEEEYTQWIDNTKSRKNTLAPEWIGGIAVVILLLMGSAAYYIKNKSDDKSEITQLTPTETTTPEELTSTQPEPDLPEPQQSLPAQEEPASVPPAVSANKGTAVPPSSATVKAVPQKQATLPAAKTIKTKPVVTDNTKSTSVAIKEEPKAPAPVVAEPAPVVTARTSKTATPEAETRQQKKTFSEKIDGFFNKVIKAKKVEPGVPAGTPEPAATEGERKAVHGGEQAPAAAEPAKKDLSSGIEVTTIEPSNTWMQGVHGLRMKVENKNDVKVTNASVEVRYLNDQNAVIEKRTIRLNPIAAGKQITLDIPDHRLADHATATLISAGN